MESSRFVTLDKELLLEVVQNLSYLEILRWCDSNPRFRGLCQNDPLFNEGVIRMKLLEEGLAQIYVDTKRGIYHIYLDMIQDKTSFSLYLTIEDLSELLNRTRMWEKGQPDFPTDLSFPTDLTFKFWDFEPLYGRGQFIRIEDSNLKYIILATDLKNILLVASEMIEKGITLDAKVEGHVVLLLDGSTEFIAH